MPSRQEATCRHCGHRIMRFEPGRPWFHQIGFRVRRGCRAASFDRDGTWDDTLARHWVAAPA